MSAENYFMWIVGIVLGIYTVVMIFREIFKRYSISLPFQREYCLKDIFAWVICDKEMIKRLIITAGILIGLHFVFLIPLPGIDLLALRYFFN